MSRRPAAQRSISKAGSKRARAGLQLVRLHEQVEPLGPHEAALPPQVAAPIDELRHARPVLDQVGEAARHGVEPRLRADQVVARVRAHERPDRVRAAAAEPADEYRARQGFRRGAHARQASGPSGPSGHRNPHRSRGGGRRLRGRGPRPRLPDAADARACGSGDPPGAPPAAASARATGRRGPGRPRCARRSRPASKASSSSSRNSARRAYVRSRSRAVRSSSGKTSTASRGSFRIARSADRIRASQWSSASLGSSGMSVLLMIPPTTARPSRNMLMNRARGNSRRRVGALRMLPPVTSTQLGFPARLGRGVEQVVHEPPAGLPGLAFEVGPEPLERLVALLGLEDRLQAGLLPEGPASTNRCAPRSRTAPPPTRRRGRRRGRPSRRGSGTRRRSGDSGGSPRSACPSRACRSERFRPRTRGSETCPWRRSSGPGEAARL